jgi:hypothetical protein
MYVSGSIAMHASDFLSFAGIDFSHPRKVSKLRTSAVLAFETASLPSSSCDKSLNSRLSANLSENGSRGCRRARVWGVGGRGSERERERECGSGAEGGI